MGRKTLAAWTVLLRGIAHRKGRSLLVLLLATIATTATVLAPAYSRAAQQSVLTDGLRSAPHGSTDLVVAVKDPNSSVGTVDETKVGVAGVTGRYPQLKRYVGRGTGAVATETTVTLGSQPVAARLAYRDNVCAHLRITGECPIDTGEVLVSDRSAKAHRINVGDKLRMHVGPAGGGKNTQPTVVGTYTPRDAAEPYWGNSVYFSAAAATESTGVERIDAVFVTGEDDVQPVSGLPIDLSVTYPLDTGALRLADVGTVRDGLDRFGLDLQAAGMQLSTALPDVLKGVDVDEASIARTVPIVAVPLILLSWFVLFLLVASLTEERGPEIALAKLRGFPSGRTTRFGLGEALLLIALGGPLGLIMGLVVVEIVARSGLADGVHAEVRWPVFAAAALSLVAACAAALLAGRRTLSRPVLALLRRVPERARWTAGVLEGLVVALAAASMFAAMSDPTGPLALLAPALLAVVAGIGAARLLGLLSRRRIATSRRRGRLVGLLSAANLSRRPSIGRIVVVMTVAVALLSFAATAWDVSAQARRDNADDTVGASRVYSVAAADPQAVSAALAQADTSHHSMAVLRTTGRYSDGPVNVIGVQSDRLGSVAVWRGHSAAQVAALVKPLRPEVAAPLRVRGAVEVDAVTSGLGPDPVRIAAQVSSPGRPPRTVSMGDLVRGAHVYRAALPDCAGGCTLLGLAFGRPGTGTGPLTASVAVRAIRDTAGPLDTGFGEDGRWRVAAGTGSGGAGAAGGNTVRAGGNLSIVINSTAPDDVSISYADAPDALPVLLAGPAPADNRNAAAFTFPALTEATQRFAVTGRVPALPRVGRGLLVDFDYAVRAAARTGAIVDNDTLRYEVWADSGAPADLGDRLSQAGLQVTGEQTIDGYLDQLGRRAPALSLRLYLLAGLAAILLAMGVVLLTAYIGADARLYELAALRVTGVSARSLRASVLREYRSLLAMPLVVGFLAGIGGAVLMLPGIPLVTVRGPVGDVDYRPGFGALPASVLISLVALATVVFLALRMSRRATPDRLREGTR